MIRPDLLALLAIASLAGCASPASLDPREPGAESPTPVEAPPPTSSPTPTPATPSPTTRTPSPLPPSPPPATETGFVLIAGLLEDGRHAYFDEQGNPAPTLLVPASTTITIELRRGGEVHGFSLGGDVYASAGPGDVRFTFTSPDAGSLEYGCPVHPHEMRGTLRVG